MSLKLMTLTATWLLAKMSEVPPTSCLATVTSQVESPKSKHTARLCSYFENFEFCKMNIFKILKYVNVINDGRFFFNSRQCGVQ